MEGPSFIFPTDTSEHESVPSDAEFGPAGDRRIAAPDVLAPVGYSDDAAVLAAALASVASHVGPEEKAKTAPKMREWFG